MFPSKIFSPFQSGFRPGRCTIDNLLALETDIRTTFLKRQHLVAIFFDIEKSYDRTWRYGILQDLFNCNLRGNLPIFIQNFLSLRQFRVKVGYQLSDLFIQEEGVPQVNKLTQWSILNGFTFSTSKTSCVHFCRKRRLHPEPEIKLYGQVINVVSEVKFLGIIFDKKLTFLPHVLQLRKKLDRALSILKVLSNTSWGASRLSLLRVYRAAILSKIDYGCTIYGSARQSVLQKLNTIHHSALRLCSGAFRTSPVESLYVECHEPSLEHRRQMLTLHYFSKILTNPNHPYFNYNQSRFLQRLQDVRPSVVPSFFTRAAGFLHDFNLDTAQLLPNPVILLTPWIPHGLKFLNPFENYDETNTASDIYLQLFTHHRELYHHFIPVFTDGSKSSTQTSFACVFINSTLSFQLHPSCSIFTAEIRALLHSLSEISNYPADNYIIYSDSLSVLQALSSLHRHSHPLAFSILDLHDRLVCKGFSILLCWVPSHVGISGNEIADIAAKNASAVLDNSTPLKDFKHYINLALHSRWENHWNSQSINKLRSFKPVVKHWPTLTNRKADTIITSLAKYGPCAIKPQSLTHREVPNSIPTKDNISTHQSALKPIETTKHTSVDIELLPMAVLPPLEKRILQSRESDADAEMSSSSASEEEALEYNMSEDLEDSPAVISPPPPSKPEKANRYKNR
ncbi:hypothetical protein AVEN_230200-1 [Araneus ventricosus]|uniref:RNase H type-1 domain-containing protein n=1 Tax=Araneus ventricosus TaxID=182803 RepID=A0A4Y2VDK3_ARAVE|nr:hypothetical protein AVEN_230200-1 [Araneus ventricosus]